MTGPALAPRDITATPLPPDPHYNAKAELLQHGIPLDQVAKAYKPGVSEAIYRNITPIGYEKHDGEVVQAIADRFNQPGNKSLVPHWDSTIVNDWTSPNSTLPKRDDAWRLYLGLPQKSNTFSISPFKPSQHSDSTPYYYNIPSFENSGNLFNILLDFKDGITKPTAHGNISSLSSDPVMGNYTLGKGSDEIGHYVSYYDKWDLNAPGAESFAGHPFEIYGRIYYDPKTGDMIDPGVVAFKKAGLDESHHAATQSYIQQLIGNK